MRAMVCVRACVCAQLSHLFMKIDADSNGSIDWCVQRLSNAISRLLVSQWLRNEVVLCYVAIRLRRRSLRTNHFPNDFSHSICNGWLTRDSLAAAMENVAFLQVLTVPTPCLRVVRLSRLSSHRGA